MLLKQRDRVSATQIFKSIHSDAKPRIACDYDRAVRSLRVIIFRRENVQTMRNEQHNDEAKQRIRMCAPGKWVSE